MAGERDRSARVPPRWFVYSAWKVHRALYRLTRGRLGLWVPRPGRWGTLRLTTVGRRSGRKRSVILGYVRDGSSLVTLAMNGWATPDPAWWLNLRDQPEATVELADGRYRVRARAAEGAERARLWARWRELDSQLDAYAAQRAGRTEVVILDPSEG